mmetsp:Transcript_11795/g.22084  ORF Transcript_11795/g.22084 Transcript_11795/m.22084 type:complete len:380 (-) Transcript_11795:86-1225(-)
MQVSGFYSFNASDCFQSSRCAKSMARHRLCRIHLEVRRVREDLLNRGHLCDVTQRSTGGMSVDVVDFLSLDSSICHGKLHTRPDSIAILSWLRHVVGIARHRTTQVLGYDLCASLLCVLEALHHQNAAAFTHHESVPVLIPRSRCLRRHLVACGQGSARVEACKGNGVHGGFRATHQHEVSVAVSNVPCCKVVAVVCRCTSGRDGIVWSHETNVHSKHGTWHVWDDVRNEEGGNFVGSPVVVRVHVLLEEGHSSNTRAHEATAPFLLELLELVLDEARVLQRLLSGHDAELDHLVLPPGVLPIDVSLRFEDVVGARRCELHREVGRVELVQGLHARLSFKQVVVEHVRVLSITRRHAKTCYHNPILRASLRVVHLVLVE